MYILYIIPTPITHHDRILLFNYKSIIYYRELVEKNQKHFQKNTPPTQRFIRFTFTCTYNIQCIYV